MQNKLNKKNNWLFILGMIIIFIFFLNFGFKKNKGELFTKCKNIKDSYNKINNWDNNISKCYGYIYVLLPFQERYYSIVDDLHDKDIAEIKSIEDIKFINNKIYFKPVNLYSGYSENLYTYDYFDGQQIKTLKVSSKKDLPKYLIIDTDTTATRVYENFSDIPINEQQYFLK